MNQIRLGSFLATAVNGGERIMYMYDVVDSEGNTISTNKRQTFYVVDPELMAHIDAIRDYILERRTNE